MSTPTLISWNLTRRCNLACGHCYLDAVHRKSDAGDELGLAEVAQVIDEIASLAPAAMLVLTGGEPLLRRDLEDIVEHAAGRALMPVVGTNGMLLDEARARRLREAGAAGVGISLDSPTPPFHDRLRGHAGAWAGALDGMRAARAAGLGVLMQTTLFEENRRQLADFAALAGDVGAMALNFFFLVCTGRGVTQTDLSPAAYEESLRAILALQAAHPHRMVRARCAPYARRMLGLHAGQGSARDAAPPSRGQTLANWGQTPFSPDQGQDGGQTSSSPDSDRGQACSHGVPTPAAAAAAPTYADWSSACLAGRKYLRIGPQGEVTPCPYIPEASGNVRWQPLREIWENGADFVRLRGEMPGGKCGGCDWRISCGGCRARALATTGDLMAEDAKCGYLPAPGARPEAPPAPGVPAVAWECEAQRLLDRIPGFVRDKVRASLERKAREAGEDCITLEFMRAHRPAGLPFGAGPPQAGGQPPRGHKR